MIRRLLLAAAVLICAASIAPAFWQSRDSNYNVNISGGSAYTGPLDVVGTSVSACYSLRACSSATRGHAAVNACNSTGGVDVGCGDLSTDATTGNLVAATVGGITCPGANCTIKIWYDQSQSGLCGGVCDMSQTTVAQRASLTANCINTTLPCATFVGSNSTHYDNGTGTPLSAQPYTVSHVTNHTGAAFNSETIWSGNNGTAQRYADFSGSNDIDLSVAGGTSVGVTGVTDNAFHSIVTVVNGASSNITVDGTSNVVSPGAGNGGTRMQIGSEFGAKFLDGKVTELLVWQTNLTTGASSQAANVCHNQFSYWGTSVSC